MVWSWGSFIQIYDPAHWASQLVKYFSTPPYLFSFCSKISDDINNLSGDMMIFIFSQVSGYFYLGIIFSICYSNWMISALSSNYLIIFSSLSSYLSSFIKLLILFSSFLILYILLNRFICSFFYLYCNFYKNF